MTKSKRPARVPHAVHRGAPMLMRSAPEKLPDDFRKTSEHRVFIVCDCGQQVPAGRLHQHVCKETK